MGNQQMADGRQHDTEKDNLRYKCKEEKEGASSIVSVHSKKKVIQTHSLHFITLKN